MHVTASCKRDLRVGFVAWRTERDGCAVTVQAARGLQSPALRTPGAPEDSPHGFDESPNGGKQPQVWAALSPAGNQAAAASVALAYMGRPSVSAGELLAERQQVAHLSDCRQRTGGSMQPRSGVSLPSSGATGSKPTTVRNPSRLRIRFPGAGGRPPGTRTLRGCRTRAINPTAINLVGDPVRRDGAPSTAVTAQRRAQLVRDIDPTPRPRSVECRESRPFAIERAAMPLRRRPHRLLPRTAYRA